MKHSEQMARILVDYADINKRRKSGELADAEAIKLFRELPTKYQTWWERIFG